MNVEYAIRPITRAEVPAAIALVTNVLAEFELAFGDGSATDTAMHDLPESYTAEGGAFWIALAADGAVVGTCGLSPVVAASRDFELRKMYLAASARGHGLGRQLLDRAIDFARAHGGTRLVLDTTDQMKAAIYFYEKSGFVRDDAQLRGARCSRGYSLLLSPRADPPA